MPTDRPYQITATLKKLAKATRRVPAKHTLTTNETALCAVLTDDEKEPIAVRIESTAEPTEKHIHLLTLWGTLGRYIAELVAAEELEDEAKNNTDMFVAEVILDLTDQLFRYLQNPDLFALKLRTREMVERFGRELEAELAKEATAGSREHGSN